MAIYTVHQPPPRRYEASPDPERFVFVRDGFSFWAFLFGPLWMLRHRMWLVLFGYVAFVVALLVVLRLLRVGGGVAAFSGLMLAILVGMEAGTLRRFGLRRRGWNHLGVIAGDSVESAERRFFDLWLRGETLAPESPVQTPPAPRPSAPEVIGLFPQPGARR
jgi:hypothetical protein